MMRRWVFHQQKYAAAVLNSPSTVAIVLLLISIALLTAMDALAKWILQGNLHVLQLLFIRGCIIIPFLLFSFSISGKLHRLKPTRLKWQILRGVIGFLAPFCFFLSITYLPLTSTNVVFFSGIFMITILSALILKERIGPARWAAVFVGYIGVFVAIDPSGEGSTLGYLLAVAGSTAYAALFISGKMLSKTETSESLVLFYNLGVSAVAVLLLPPVWQSMNAHDWLLLTAFSALALSGQYGMTHAYSLADASLLAPLDYTSLIWTVLFDVLIWQTIPSMQTFLGAFIIVGSSAFVIWRQHLQDRRYSIK